MPNLVGIGLSQVPTNSMLGGLAYQSPDHASIKDLDLKNLSQINSEIAGTARDIFIYDTSKDSDGGAWRKRTSHTSWYNETLNTSVRGSRREFPAVAVIVGNSGNITIYDGDDPDLPMWMVFNTKENGYDTNYMIWGTYNVVMKNGWLYSGSPSGQSWENVITRVNFISEQSNLITASGLWYGKKSIADRNTANLPGATSSNYDTSSITIAANSVNDIAMTVLPNAPIDSATGLPVPTIAVATNGGVSVIKDDGTVVDAVGTGFDEVNSISFDKNNRIICSSGTTGTDQAMFSTFAIPSSDLSNDFPGGDNAYYRHTYANTDLSTFPSNGSASNHSINEVSIYGDDICFGTEDDGSTLNPGLKIISENVTSPANGMLCGISTSYNTGWMHGDIKGAFLSDTDTTAASSSSLISGNNSTFDSGTGNWSAPYQSTIAAVSGQLQMTATGGNPYARLYVTVEIGKTYRLDIDSISHNFSTAFQIWFGNASGLAQSQYGAINLANGTSYNKYFTATTTTLNLQIVGNGSVGQVGTVDNIFLYELEEDRSVNNKGLQVFGTITKSPVATGADLVAYSGFSASNYLRQPYNSSLDFGTGDFSVMFWAKVNSSNDFHPYVSKLSGADNSGIGWNISKGSDNTLYFYTRNLSNASFTPTSGYPAKIGIWALYCFTRSSNGTINRYDNGSLVVSTSATVRDVSSSPSDLLVGEIFNFTQGDNTGFISLLRISGSIPSPEQIKKIYEDEKVLFQENAACTLYGTSSAVTALAYDEVTDRLHVGTSSGRSDFQGLRRINNTTTAVTTAISAHDEFIIEQ